MSATINQAATGRFTLPEVLVKHPCLVVEASPESEEQGLHFILLSTQVKIGRSPECAIALRDEAVSRLHVMLNVTHGESGPMVKVSNLGGERGGTRIGNEPLGTQLPVALKPGDTLRLGRTVLRYVLFEHEAQLGMHLDSATRLMREAEYARALGGLTGLRKYRLIGSARFTPLERILLSAQYYEARILSIQGKWGRAMKLFSELVESERSGRELRIKAAFQLGVLYVHQNDLSQAQRLVDQMWGIADSTDAYFLALVHCLNGMVGARRRDLPFAQKAFAEATAMLQRSGRDPANLSARILLESAIASFLAEQHELALNQLVRLGSDVSRTAMQKVISAEALRYRGVISSRRREFEQADYLFREALRVFQETKWRFLECKAQKSRALNYLSWGRLGEAAVHLQLCQKLLAEEVENDYEGAVVAAHLGTVYLTRGDAQEALRWFEQEKSLQMGVGGVEHSRAYTHRNFARAHRNLGHAQEATGYYVQAAVAFSEFSNFVQQGYTLLELCRCRIEAGDGDEAATDLASAERCFQAVDGRERFEPMLDALRAQLAWAHGDHGRAHELFASSFDAMKSFPASYFLAETYLCYGRLCAELYRRETQAQDTVAASTHYQEAKRLFEEGARCAAGLSLGYLLEQFRKEIESLDSKALTRLMLSRVVSPEALDPLLENSFHSTSRTWHEERTVLFVDLSGYTAMAEREDLDEVRDILNEFYGFATRIIHQRQGMVDKFIGDCVMALFKGTVTGVGLQNQAVAAVSSAFAILEEVEHLSERRPPNQRRLAASAGICTGRLLVGWVGSLQHMNYTCIGDVVNVAARLQGLARPGEMLVSDQTYQACMKGGMVPFTSGDIREARVKNREQPVRYWSLDRETGRMVPSVAR